MSDEKSGAVAPKAAPMPQEEQRASWIFAALAGFTALGLTALAFFFAVRYSDAPAEQALSPRVLVAASQTPSASPTSAPPTPSPTAAGPTVTLVPGEECGRVVVAGTDGNWLTLRVNPTTSAGIIGRIPEGTSLVLLCDAQQRAEGHIWQRVRTPDGRRGWVSSLFLRAA